MSVLSWVLAAAFALANGATAPGPEQAFQVTATQAGEGRVNLTFVIAPGTALYRDELTVEPLQSDAGFQPAALDVPPGVAQAGPDGEQEVVLRGVVPAKLTGAGVGGVLRIKLRGCADAGICYPPLVLDVPIRG